MQIICVVITLLASVVISSASNGTYVVVSSKVARFGVPYTVSVILAETRKIVQTGSLVLTNSMDTSQTKSQSFSIDPTENKKDVEMTIMPGDLDPGRNNLRFQMILNGKSIDKSTSIELNGDAGICMIMTDRGIYKRSQKVQFRVVCLNDELKPITKEMDITIVDPDGNKVEMYKRQSNAKGVISHNYMLSDDPKEGVWKLQVQQSDGEGSTSERNITVESYVLPRFSPEISFSQPFVNVKDFTSVQVIVKGMYTYGEPVHGEAQIICNIQGTKPIQKKAVLRDGIAKLTLTQNEVGDPSTLKQRLCGAWYCWDAPKQSFPMTINGKVIEFTTKEEQETTSTLNFYTEPVAIKLVNVKEFRKNMTYTAYFHITDPSGQPLPKSERSKYYIKVEWKADYNEPGYAPATEELPTDTDDVIIKSTWTPPEAQYSLYVKGEVYEKSTAGKGRKVVSAKKYLTPYNSFTGAGVQIELLNSANSQDGVRSATKIFDIGDTIHVRTTGNSPKGFKTDMFLYLMAKGKQVKSYEVSSGTITDIVIDQSMGLAPSASLLLWSLSTGGELVADEMEIFVSGLLKNTMSMEFNKNRQFVGQSVTLTVASKPNSDIFVVAIDKGSQILKEPNDITFDQTNEAIMKFDTREEKKDVNNWFRPMARRKRDTTQSYYSGTAAKNIMQTVGCVYITDGHVAEVQEQGGIVFDDAIAEAAFPGSVQRKTDTGQTDQSVSSSTSSANQIRKFFPESWIWLDGNVGSDGTFQQDFTLPDTITSWTTRGFSISPEYGLGIASNIKVEGFKDFFVVVSLPASALRGEKVEVKLVVFNYYDTDKQVRLRLKHSNDFVIYDHKPTNISKPITGDFEKNFQVQAKMSKGERCYIESSGIGMKTLRVEASAGMVSGGTFNVEITDTVLKKIPIDPEGKKIYGGYQKLLDATSSSLKLRPMFPQNYVPDSRDLTVGVTGDIMGKALANIDKLLRVPSGCGEQNMIGLVPNIYALLYMEANSITNAEIKDKAIQNMKRGYQRELNYKHTDGGFSAFGDSDPSFSTWLTAFVMKAFAQASEFIFVDDKVLKEAKEALMSKSGKDGDFREDGKVHHNDLNAGTSGGEMLTAYVYVAIMETKNAGSAIDSFDASKTLTYLENFYTTSKSSSRVQLSDYQLAVLSYCFALGKSQKLDLVLADLDGSSTKSDDGMTCWCYLKEEVIDNRKSYWSNPKPTAIETAAYVLLAYIEKNDLNKGLKVVKWLMTQSNSRGGFASTQDTVMALQALSKYAELVSSVDRNLEVKFMTTGLTDVVFNINNDNFLMLQQEDLKNNINEITQKGVEIIVQGTGNVVASLNWEYNLDIDDKFEELKVTVETFEIDEFTTQIRTCVWYTGNEDTGMVVVNVGLITGYTLTSLDKLQKEGGIKRVENNVNKLDIYFDQITAIKTCFSVETVQEYIVIEHKSQPVSAYLYYAPEKSTTVYYDFKSVIKPTGDTVGLSSCNIILMFMTLISTTFTMVQF